MIKTLPHCGRWREIVPCVRWSSVVACRPWQLGALLALRHRHQVILDLIKPVIVVIHQEEEMVDFAAIYARILEEEVSLTNVV